MSRFGGCCTTDTQPAEDIKFLPRNQALRVADTFAKTDVYTNARAAYVQGLAFGTDGEADAALADVGSQPGKNGDTFIESNAQGGYWKFKN